MLVTSSAPLSRRSPRVGSVSATWWPAVAILGGVLLLFAGAVVLWSGSAWPASSRRYGSAKPGPDASARSANDRAVVEWDELTRGDDPTDEVGPAGDDPSDGGDASDAAAVDFDPDGRAADEPGAADR